MDTLEAKQPKISGTPSDTAHKALDNIPESTKTNAEIEDRLIAARISMLLHCPFYGTLACRLEMRDATEWCPTAATDGKYLYYNAKFVNMLSISKLVFLIAHEVLHNVYDHMGRRGDRHPRLWNIANDFCVNGDLVEGNVGAMIDEFPICFVESIYNRYNFNKLQYW